MTLSRLAELVDALLKYRERAMPRTLRFPKLLKALTLGSISPHTVPARFWPHGAKCSLILASISMPSVSIAQSTDSDSNTIVLDEQWSVPLEAIQAPVGMDISREGLVLIWGSDWVKVYQDKGTRVTSPCDGRLTTVVAAGFVGVAQTIYILTTNPDSLFRASVDGSCPEAMLFKSGASSTVGTVHPNGTILLLREKDGISTLEVAQIPTGRRLWRYRLKRDGDAMKGDEILLSGSELGFTINSMHPPYEFLTVAMNGEGTDEVNRITPALKNRLRGEGAEWIALQAVPLQKGRYIQTIVDVRGDRRLIVIVDDSGRVLRQVAVQVPMRFIDASPRSRLLLAGRNLETQELVVYRWARREQFENPLRRGDNGESFNSTVGNDPQPRLFTGNAQWGGGPNIRSVHRGVQ